MTGILDKYDESIKLTYNYTYRMLMNLKNIRENYRKLENADEIILEVYRDSICNIVFAQLILKLVVVAPSVLKVIDNIYSMKNVILSLAYKA